ncbi:MAG: zinc ribbon domain-containing protein [Geminicoccaceae bacterium]|nr:zinc ribbon domain-containing protein [Geminicoccaceae bacterium]
MPLYTYTCSTHGEFKAWGKMSESDAPMPCPTCSTVSPRALAKPMVAKSGEAGAEVAGGEGCGLEGCGMGACASEGGGFGGGHVCGAGCVH